MILRILTFEAFGLPTNIFQSSLFIYQHQAFSSQNQSGYLFACFICFMKYLNLRHSGSFFLTQTHCLKVLWPMMFYDFQQSLISFIDKYYIQIINQIKSNMNSPKKQYDVQLLDSNEKPTQTPANNVTNEVTWNEFDYKQFQNAPKITFTGLVLIILCPVLVCAHIKVCNMAAIPMVQFVFVTTLFAFLINYTLIIRRYELMPFLPDPLYDSKLKRMCVFAVGGMIISMIWGWNGSGGILFAMGWQSVRGNRFGFYGYMLIIIVVGSLLMQENFNWKKLIQFIPGTLFGSINAQLFTLRDSSFYAIGHQFLLLAAIITPIMFPAFHIIVPSIVQWIIMIVGGITVLFTTLCSIKLMQNERVSVVMGVMSGIMMIGTCDFSSHLDYIGAAIILVGGALIIKKEYIDVAI